MVRRHPPRRETISHQPQRPAGSCQLGADARPTTPSGSHVRRASPTLYEVDKRSAGGHMGMSASDAAPLPRLGEIFFDVRGSSRSMRLSWYSNTGVAVFSIWQGGTCTGTFRLAAANGSATGHRLLSRSFLPCGHRPAAGVVWWGLGVCHACAGLRLPASSAARNRATVNSANGHAVPTANCP